MGEWHTRAFGLTLKSTALVITAFTLAHDRVITEDQGNQGHEVNYQADQAGHRHLDAAKPHLATSRFHDALAKEEAQPLARPKRPGRDEGREKAIAHRFLTAEAKAPVLFDNVRLFDADKGVFVENQAVLARGGKIAAIGAAGSIAPAGARVVDGKGKTLVPGIWDSHMHIGGDWDVLANLANGMTSFRSPGTTFDRAVDAVKRRASGELLMGEPFISVIIDKKDPLAAQGSEVVTSEAEAIALIRQPVARALAVDDHRRCD